MPEIKVRTGRPKDSQGFLQLVLALAEFERLTPPTKEGRDRLVRDVFSRKRLNLFVAARGNELVGYALYFYTYSSFLARPTLYLEDLYVLEEYRKKGVGWALLKRCMEEAVAQECGRMEWSVLTWNVKAINFYEKLGAKRLADWQMYRLDEQALRRLTTSTAQASGRKRAPNPRTASA